MRKLLEEKVEKEKKEEEVFEANMEGAEAGIVAYLEWKGAGKPVDEKGRIKPSLKQAKAIVRTLMPTIDHTKKISDYNTVYKIVNWLERLGNWAEEMENLDRDAAKKRVAAHKPLFSFTHIP